MRFSYVLNAKVHVYIHIIVSIMCLLKVPIICNKISTTPNYRTWKCIMFDNKINNKKAKQEENQII